MYLRYIPFSFLGQTFLISMSKQRKFVQQLSQGSSIGSKSADNDVVPDYTFSNFVSFKALVLGQLITRSYSKILWIVP